MLTDVSSVCVGSDKLKTSCVETPSVDSVDPLGTNVARDVRALEGYVLVCVMA